MNKIIFVSSPYTHRDKDVVRNRVIQTTLYCARLVAEGHVVFSPIVYGQALLDVHEMPNTYEFWNKFCFTFLSKCSEFHALMLEGYNDSEGMMDEMVEAKRLGLPIELKEFKE